MMTVRELFAKILGFISGLLWLGTFAAAVWQIWFTLSTGLWEWLTVSSIASIFPMNFQPMAFYSVLVYTVVTKLPLILAAGLLATFTSFLANKLD
jgi:hypothetical protein